MKITGELLKSERLKKNISVQDVAFALKLSPRIINAIEDGNLKVMPAKTFIRGFVKSYAEYLKLDSDAVLRQFQEEMGSTQPLPKTPPPQPAEVVQRRYAKTDDEEKEDKTEMLNNSNKTKTFLYTGVAVVILILIIGINKVVDHYQKQKIAHLIPNSSSQPISQTSTTAPADTTKTNAEASPTITADASNSNATPTTVPTSNPQPVPATQNTAEQQAPQTAKTANAEKPTEPVAVQKPVEKITPITTTVEENFEPASQKPVELIVEARKEVEFLYAKGNTKNFTSVHLKPKQVQVIRSPSGIHIKTNDGSALILTVNGVEKGTPSSTVKPFKASY